MSSLTASLFRKYMGDFMVSCAHGMELVSKTSTSNAVLPSVAFQAATRDVKNLRTRSPRRPVSSEFQAVGVVRALPMNKMHFNGEDVVALVAMTIVLRELPWTCCSLCYASYRELVRRPKEGFIRTKTGDMCHRRPRILIREIASSFGSMLSAWMEDG